MATPMIMPWPKRYSKCFKTEFSKGVHSASFEQLALKVEDYVHWFNDTRIQGTVGYLTPV